MSQKRRVRKRDFIIDVDRFNELMEEKRTNANKIAVYIGVHRSSITRLAKGELTGVSADMLIKLAQYFKVSPADLLTIKDPEAIHELEALASLQSLEERTRDEEIGRQIVELLKEHPEQATALASLPPNIDSETLLKTLQTAIRLKGRIKPEDFDPDEEQQ